MPSPPTTGGNPYTGSSGYPVSILTDQQQRAMSSQIQGSSPLLYGLLPPGGKFYPPAPPPED